jgi:hypothetical protein
VRRRGRIEPCLPLRKTAIECRKSLVSAGL